MWNGADAERVFLHVESGFPLPRLRCEIRIHYDGFDHYRFEYRASGRVGQSGFRRVDSWVFCASAKLPYVVAGSAVVTVSHAHENEGR
jgi:hypothetical protein